MENREGKIEKMNYLFGMHPVFEAISAGKNIDKVFLKKGLDGEQFRQLLDLLQQKNIPFQFVPVERLDRFTRGRHQGVVAQISMIDYVPIEQAVEYAFQKTDKPLFLLLDGVSDVRNFGAIARTAECAGVDCIVLPAKGGASITPDSIKTSSGALLTMQVSKVPNLRTAVYLLMESGFRIVAATEKANEHIYSVDFNVPTAIILGSEDKGISESLRRLATCEAKIPMAGHIGSLNVSAAAAVVLYEAVRQRTK